MSAQTTVVVECTGLDQGAVIDRKLIGQFFESLRLIGIGGRIEVKVVVGSLDELVRTKAQQLLPRRPGKPKEMKEIKRILEEERRRGHG